jgi:hypothetical protein
MKIIFVKVTATVAIEVPDDFPIGPAEIQKAASARANDCPDGRYPGSTENIDYATERIAKTGIEIALYHHFEALYVAEKKSAKLANEDTDAALQGITCWPHFSEPLEYPTLLPVERPLLTIEVLEGDDSSKPIQKGEERVKRYAPRNRK